MEMLEAKKNFDRSPALLRRKRGVHACMLEFMCKASFTLLAQCPDQDKFNAKMSVIIRSKKEGRLEVKSGYYTEKRMIEELKFSKPHCCTFP